MYTVELYMFIEYPQDLIWSSSLEQATTQNSDRDRRGDLSLLNQTTYSTLIYNVLRRVHSDLILHPASTGARTSHSLTKVTS